MDFRRSTIVLLISFFCLNLFLFSIFWQMREENKTPTSNGVINVTDQMKADGITYNGVTEVKEQAPMIQTTPAAINEAILSLENQTVTYDRGIITGELKQPLVVSGLDGTTPVTAETFAAVTDFVNQGNIAFGDQYTWFSYNPVTRQLIYTQRANRLPIADGTSQVVFFVNAANEIEQYQQTVAGTVEVLGTNREVISSQRALEILYLAGRIPSKSTVTVIRLTYYRTLALNEQSISVYTPTWYVELRQSDGQLVSRRVDGLRGTVVTSDRNNAMEVVPQEPIP